MPKLTKRSSPPVVSLISLGCPKNLVDSENLLGKLKEVNFDLTAAPEDSDVVVVNTCGFIDPSRQEGGRVLAEMLALKAQGKVERVVAMGCWVTKEEREVRAAYPGLDGVYKLGEEHRLVRDLAGLYTADQAQRVAGIRPITTTLPHYSYLKISEGCDRTCTYCTIPSIRGPQKDRSIGALMEESERLAQRGVVELNLIAQDLTAYGMTRDKRPRLLDLLKKLEEVESLRWIRLLYAYPDHLDEELIEHILQSPKILNYLDIPIQHVASGVLRRMNRKGSFEIYDKLFDSLRRADPDFCLRTTVIVGFPGETDAEFDELMAYCRERRFDRLGGFRYVFEETTASSRMKNQVDEEIKLQRYDALMRQQQEIHLNDNQSWVGRDIEFIVDEWKNHDGTEMLCRTWRDAVEIDANIHVKSTIPLPPGTVAVCRVTGTCDYDLEGVL